MTSRRRRVEAPRNVEIELDIDTLSHEGRGVGRVEGKAVFVHGALPGERVRARLLKRHGSFDEAESISVLSAAPTRVAPRCAHFGVCGGCSMQHTDEATQLAHKQSVLIELLHHQGGLEPTKVAPPITGPQWGYRRKARLGVKFVIKKGRTLIGFRERAKPYVADCQSCDILDPRVGARLPEIRSLIESLSVSARIPQIEVAVGDDTVALVLRHLEPLNEADCARLKDYAVATGIEIYLQPSGYDSIRNLSGGREVLEYTVDGLKFEFRPADFTQINSVINARMVARALELLRPAPTDRVVDLFCGLGNFTLPIARRAGQVLGVEVEPTLIERAYANARLNHIDNVSFVTLDLAKPQSWASLDITGHNKMLLDPPRSGAAAVFEGAQLDAIERVVYVSCNPVTFARDAAMLVHRHGFRLDESGILDMFPQTAHVESISLFIRK